MVPYQECGAQFTFSNVYPSEAEADAARFATTIMSNIPIIANKIRQPNGTILQEATGSCTRYMDDNGRCHGLCAFAVLKAAGLLNEAKHPDCKFSIVPDVNPTVQA